MKRPNDMDLMLYHDGELTGDDAAAVAAALSEHDDARRVEQSLGQVGDVLRSYAELATDDADARAPLADVLWSRIEPQLHGNRRAASEADARAAAAQPAMWGRLIEWLGAHRGHFITGAACAAAAALLVMALQSPQIVEKRVEIPAPTPAVIPTVAVSEQAQEPEVEHLEVYDGSGTFFTLPGDETHASTAVIWITSEDEVEGSL